MNIRKIAIAAVMSCMLPGCTDCPPGQVSSGDGNVLDVPEHAIVPGAVTVRVSEHLAERLLESCSKDGTVATKASGFSLSGGNVTGVRTLFRIGGKFEARQREAGLHRWFVIEYDTDVPSTKASSEIMDMEGVELAEPVLRIKRNSVEMNDPYLSGQWHYCNTGQYGFAEGIDIRLQEAWDTYGVFGDSSVTVAIIDGGVDITHPDLIGNLWTNEAELNGTAGADDDGNGYRDDVHGYNFVTGSADIHGETHGTHVAGTVSAVNNNGIGVCGVAGGRYPEIPGARLMCLQIMDDRYEDRGAYIEPVFQYAADNGAVIAQNSWGYEVSPSSMPASEKAAIDYFIRYAGTDEYGRQTGPMKGGLVVFAAGNENVSLSYPGAYEKVLSVAAIGPYGSAAYYTNYGPWVDVCAPGGDLQANYQYGGVMSTVPGRQYARLQGTSMACPHVSGLAALVLSCAGREGYTCDDLYRTIIDTADPDIYNYNPARKGQLGSGMIDAVKALSFLHTAPDDNHPPVIEASDDSPIVVGPYGTVTRSYTSSDIDGDRTRISCAAEGNTAGLTYSCPAENQVTVSIDGAKSTAGEYSFTITAVDQYGTETFLTVPYTVQENHAPAMIGEIGTAGINGAGSSVSFSVYDYFSDEDGEPLAVIANVSDRNVVAFSYLDGEITLKGLRTGTAEVRLTVCDTRGAAAGCKFSVFVRDASRPFDLYPNPAREYVNVRTGEDRECIVEICSSTGTKMFSAKSFIGISRPMQINVAALAPGTYTVALTGSDGSKSKANFVKL
ncbi:MAG: S8 family serine peptidase [Bacteroidales bacterium]|nr:S8 family serine peptidase [Bacteroidales bacterium]